MTKTKEEVEKEFKQKLAALLAEYDQPNAKATIELDSISCGYYDKYNICVTIPSQHDKDGNCISEWTEINLGESFWGIHEAA